MEGGVIRATSSDDAVSVSRGTDAGREDDGSRMYMRGGRLVAHGSGDGVDINGSGEMSGGTLIIFGPNARNNGALDYNGSFEISGGMLVGVGGAGMAQAPAASSAQNSLLVFFDGSQSAGTLVHLQSADGTELVTLEGPSDGYQSFVFSSPAFVSGESYAVYLGGSHSGTNEDGLFSGGAYTPGSEYDSFTASGGVTQLGSGGGRP